MKYKVGDKIKIRSDLEIGKYYGSDRCVKGMEEYLGREVEVLFITGDCYEVKEDKRSFYWTDEMLEKSLKEKVLELIMDKYDIKEGEEFKIGRIRQSYKIENNRVYNECVPTKEWVKSELFFDLVLDEKVEIKKIPWIPKEGNYFKTREEAIKSDFIENYKKGI